MGMKISRNALDICYSTLHLHRILTIDSPAPTAYTQHMDNTASAQTNAALTATHDATAQPHAISCNECGKHAHAYLTNNNRRLCAACWRAAYLLPAALPHVRVTSTTEPYHTIETV